LLVPWIVDTCGGDKDTRYWTFSSDSLPILYLGFMRAGNAVKTCNDIFSADVSQTFSLLIVAVCYNTNQPCGRGLAVWCCKLFYECTREACNTIALLEIDITGSITAVGYRESFRRQVLAICFCSVQKFIVDSVYLS